MTTAIITGSASLRVLNVSDNPISDDGMSLIWLSGVAECGLSVKDVYRLVVLWLIYMVSYHNWLLLLWSLQVLFVSVKCSLQVLDMSHNNIGDDGITAIA